MYNQQSSVHKEWGFLCQDWIKKKKKMVHTIKSVVTDFFFLFLTINFSLI